MENSVDMNGQPAFTIMKRVLLAAAAFLLVSCKHYIKLDGLYFSDRQDCFAIDGKESAIETKDNSVISRLTAKQNARKIKFLQLRRRTVLPFITYNRKYRFQIVYNSEDSFIVAPRSRFAKAYYDDRPYLTFKSKYAFADPIVFDSIIYHSSRCFGFCHDLHMKINKYGDLKVTDNGDGQLDTASNGNYVGKLSTTELDRLYRILKYSQLKKLEWPQRHCFDAPVLTLIIYTPTQCYYFKAMDFCVPILSFELTGFLSKQFYNRSLKKVNENFFYEE